MLENPVFAALSSQDWSFTDEGTQNVTHGLHPYPAKFIPQIPGNLIPQLSRPGDLVLDPFGGSGTTAVEAVRVGRRVVSLDANPLSALLGRVKTAYLSPIAEASLRQLQQVVRAELERVPDLRDDLADSTELRSLVPDIPNITKWFQSHVIHELCVLRQSIDRLSDNVAKDVAAFALSRIIVRVSNQDSETRYTAVEKQIPPNATLRIYLDSLDTVISQLAKHSNILQGSNAIFHTADSRTDMLQQVDENSVSLVITSPPYPNATDYHLYHRFRLFWLGHNPNQLRNVEIGSHLKYQGRRTAFEEYIEDMTRVLQNIMTVLVPGCYAVFVVGDAIIQRRQLSTSAAIESIATQIGFEVIGTIERPIHHTRRSFIKPARRARVEQIVVLQKPVQSFTLYPPSYRMWSFEEYLRIREIENIVEQPVEADPAKPITVQGLGAAMPHVRGLTFTKAVSSHTSARKLLPTWQAMLENGGSNGSNRKDSRYVTHGLHPFKGKFYPQLVKALLNISQAPTGSAILDPYCGSGTTVLEGMLNGFASYGCDSNPLAVRIASAKTSILTVPQEDIHHSIGQLLRCLSDRNIRFPNDFSQFPFEVRTELFNWFSEEILRKMNWLLANIRSFDDNRLVDFFEMIMSSFIRDISDQDPSDLRMRRRKIALSDAPVLEIFSERLQQQYKRLQHYWEIADHRPAPTIYPIIIEGDSRESITMTRLGLTPTSVSCVITSPPYATALPYVDTYRLSLLAIMGMPTSTRGRIERGLTGSREIHRKEKEQAEECIYSEKAFHELPPAVVNLIRNIIQEQRRTTVGFRRANLPALLWRYFIDIRDNITQVRNMLKSGASAFYVVGDSRTIINGKWLPIETTRSIVHIGEMLGLRHAESISIDVTRENLKHIKNAITKNAILRFERI